MPFGSKQTHGLQYPRDAHGRELAGKDGLLPACRHEAHGGQIVDFVGPDFLKHLDDRQLVEQVGLVQNDSIREMGDAFKVFGAGSADDAVNFVAFRQQQFREIAAVLTRNACDDGLFHRNP